MITVVIARYEDDISWSEGFEGVKVDVVQKGVDLEVFGREAASFFWYIINNYDSLEGHYVFCQGNPLDHAPRIVEQVNQGVLHDYVEYGNRLLTDRPMSTSHPGLNIGVVYEELFDEPSPPVFGFAVGGGQFMVSTNNIKLRPKSFYEKALSICETNDMAPWVFERLWRVIFSG
jgi:hypothetical protein